MPLSSELKKLARQALAIRNSQVPVHRVIDVLATSDGDISKVVNRYRDINDADLRRALHYCAELLRAVEREAGLTPAWEAGMQGNTPPVNETSSGSPAQTQPIRDTTTSKTKSKFSPEDLKPFVDDTARNNTRVAKAYVDGASKGNPGEAGIGVALFSMDGRKIAQQSRAIGVATNNIAEYSALIEAMKIATDMGVKVLNVIGDSELMVRQVSGVYKIKNAEILKKVKEVMALKRGFEKFTISYVGRDHNTLADALSTALLRKKSGGNKGGRGGQNNNEEYKDMLGAVDPNADEGATE